MNDCFDIAFQFKIGKLDDLLIEKLTAENDNINLTFDILNKLNLAIRRKYKDNLAPEQQAEKNALYEKICKKVVD